MSVNNAARKETRLVDRNTILHLLDAALATRSFRFARQAALGWLAAFPGDMEVSYLLANIFLGEEKRSQAITLLERICRQDPEHTAAAETLCNAYGASEPKWANAAAGAWILGGNTYLNPIPGWAALLRDARERMAAGRLQEAEALVDRAISQENDLPLGAIMHLKVIRAQKEKELEYKFAELYHARWPETLVFSLSLAERQLELGDEIQAVGLLHQCVAGDAAGQVATRWWGPRHPYQPLWPEKLETTMELPVPAEVASRLGWNQLPAHRSQSSVVEQNTGQQSANAPAQDKMFLPGSGMPVTNFDEALRQEQNPVYRKVLARSEAAAEAEREFEKIAKKIKKPVYAKADGRYPVYVVFSSQGGLASQYGQQTAGAVTEEMRHLAEAVSQRKGWGATVFLPDDPAICTRLGLKPSPAGDPWKLKLALADLDQALAKKGARIGALLIVGGPQVIPFHRLPNPTDDGDEVVPSDNPYGTLDSNYFVPEWPVGRMPGEVGPDAGLLLQQLRAAVKTHSQRRRIPAKLASTANLMSAWLNIFGALSMGRSNRTFGYTAAVWKKSSQEAFRPIGEARSLLASPPECSGSFDSKRMSTAALAYYNLHGLPDTNEWYGQRDAEDIVPGPDFPVALTTHDVLKSGRNPNVVFTEACFGAHIENKNERDSIALRFLGIGTPAFVGSTCTAYGSVAAPLIAADLLGHYYWKYLREGYNAGEALLQAKIAVVREMTRRQGFLDGEDQKTLISFVLYGDPLTQNQVYKAEAKQYIRQRTYVKVKVASDQWQEQAPDGELPEKTILQVKKAVEPYLPGLDRAEIRVREQALAEGVSVEPDQGFKLLRRKSVTSRNKIVTIKRPVQVASKTYFQFARVTLDSHGKMIKMVLSR